MGAARTAARNRAYTVSDILKLAHKFKDIEAELYKVRRSLEPKMSELRCAQHLASCVRPNSSRSSLITRTRRGGLR